jgi:predicted RNase H-like HicB family nuclease
MTIQTTWSAKRPGPGSKVDGYILVMVRLELDDDGYYVGHAEPFGISSFGQNLDEAVEATMEATSAYLQTLDDEGIRDVVFKDLGVDFLAHEPGTEISITAFPGEFVSPQRVTVMAGSRR